MNAAFSQFSKQVTNPLLFRLFMLRKLPAAFVAGLRIRSLTEGSAVVTVRHKWINQNPFRSMYFAVQSMAAEMSTGLLASGHIHGRTPAVSMLVVGVEATFFKKVTGLVAFTCAAGETIAMAVAETMQTGESRTVRCRSVGTNEAGEEVSEFYITWSFKRRSSK